MLTREKRRAACSARRHFKRKGTERNARRNVGTHQMFQIATYSVNRCNFPLSPRKKPEFTVLKDKTRKRADIRQLVNIKS
jgi:hypothetical protein